MGLLARWVLVFGTLVLGSCALPSADKGGACTRSAQCTAGLACVRGTCTDDLSSVASQSQVPMLMATEAGVGDDAGAGH
ncbi:MAG: hypothetical protein ACHQ53_01460 [Polyangiales bacterium]